MSSLCAATSTASEIAIPSDPVGCDAFALPDCVRSDGERCTDAPHVCIIERRYGFWSYDEPTMNTSHSSPNSRHAKASAEPHCPAPVSVQSFRTPACAFSYACATAVFGLCEPAGETPSYL